MTIVNNSIVDVIVGLVVVGEPVVGALVALVGASEFRRSLQYPVLLSIKQLLSPAHSFILSIKYDLQKARVHTVGALLKVSVSHHPLVLSTLQFSREIVAQ